MSYEYSFVVTKKIGDTVDVYVYPLDKKKIDSFQIDDKAEFINYSVENKIHNEKVQFINLKEGLDNSTKDKQDTLTKDNAKKSLDNTINSDIFKTTTENNDNDDEKDEKNNKDVADEKDEKTNKDVADEKNEKDKSTIEKISNSEKIYDEFLVEPNNNFGGKKRKGRTHKKVKRGGMKTIKIRR
jgi:hypothetical protein